MTGPMQLVLRKMAEGWSLCFRRSDKRAWLELDGREIPVPEYVLEELWNARLISPGANGATLGYELAESGRAALANHSVAEQ